VCVCVCVCVRVQREGGGVWGGVGWGGVGLLCVKEMEMESVEQQPSRCF
jgi:hypothetical protein